MSLNWNVGAVKFDKLWIKGRAKPMGGVDYGDAPDAEEFMNPFVDCLIMVSMSVGLGEISEKNWELWAERIYALEAIRGPFMNAASNDPERLEALYGAKGCDKGFPLNIIKACIGLKVNVSKESDAAFGKVLARAARDEAGFKLRAAKKALEA